MLSYTQNQSVIAPGGTVFSLSADARGTLWLATGSGIWRGCEGAWQPLSEPTPLALTASLLALPSGRSDGVPLLLTGGAPANIAYSSDAGVSWQAAHVDEIDSPVTCMAASPRFTEDRVLLAGTAGSGILRSTDGGRYWRLTNAGLQEFTILALATAPAWNEREVAFAITTGGIYRSPNGGRYWKRVAESNQDMPLQALAVSPTFAEDGIVYAGGEATGIVRSNDGGRSWQSVVHGSSLAPNGINCLWMPDARIILAGTLDGAIYRSTDSASSWDCVATGYSSVLAFGASSSALFAGLYDEGLLTSTDQGETWQLEPHLAVRDITRLVCFPSGELLAFGPTGGVWWARGNAWEQLPIPIDIPPLTAVFSLPDGRMLVGTTDGLLVLAPDGGVSNSGLASSAAITALAQRGAEVWVGNAAGELWLSLDSKQQWRRVATLAGGQPLTALAVADDPAEPTIAAATPNPAAGGVTLWRSTDGGMTWARWFEQPTIWTRTSLCLGQQAGDMPTWAAIGSQVWRWSGETWQPFELDERPLVALRRVGDSPVLVAATSAGIYRCADGARGERVDVALPPGGLLDLEVTAFGEIIGLGRGGQLAIVTRSSLSSSHGEATSLAVEP